MKRIESFCVDHNKLNPGVYISRIDDDVVTYDLRFIKPNTPPYLDPKTIHTIEHLFATFARNSSKSKNVIYFGPMGCQTGFYFLVKGLSHKQALNLIKKIVKECMEFTGTIPGSKKIECGNYKFHNLRDAKKQLKTYYNTIENLSENDLYYK